MFLLNAASYIVFLIINNYVLKPVSSISLQSFVPSGEVKGFKVDALDNTRAGVFVARALSHIAVQELYSSICRILDLNYKETFKNNN